MPCSHGNRTPRELHELALKHRYVNAVVRWFGRTGEEILKALELSDSLKTEQMKMTREEAKEKVLGWTSLVDALEALGLLKFEEAEKIGLKKACQNFLDAGDNQTIRTAIDQIKKAVATW